MNVAYATICLNKEWQKSIDRGMSNDDIHPWFLTFTEGDDVYSSRHVKNLTISGTCFGDEIVAPSGLPLKVVACRKSAFVWSGDDLHILNGSLPQATEQHEARVLVRLFTPWLLKRDDTIVLPWRILEEVSPGEFMEKQARSFCINGSSFGLRYDFPLPTGPKMHIACFGKAEWDGDQVVINA